jgi:hypothetical protein
MRGAWIEVLGKPHVIAMIGASDNPDPTGRREENILEALIKFPEAFGRTKFMSVNLLRLREDPSAVVKPEPLFAPPERFLMTCRALSEALARDELGIADDVIPPRDAALEDAIGTAVVRHHGLDGIERMFGR